MTEPFSEKLNLVLKALSLSRARLAAELGADKSVVARWASGATMPSSHNLAQLSTLIARSAPGFTALDWDRDLEGLAERLGVSRVTPKTAAAPPVTTPTLALPFLDQIVATTTLRGSAYEGFYRSTRPFAGQPGRFIHDHLIVRPGPDGLLRFKMSTGGVNVEGWVLPMQNQLFTIGVDFNGGGLVYGILNGVNTTKAGWLDGVLLTAGMDIGRSPTASTVIYQRIAELSADAAADDARLAELAAGNPVAPEGSVPSDVREHLTRDFFREAGAIGGLLRMPLLQSLSRGPDEAIV